MYAVYQQACCDVCRNLVGDLDLPNLLGFDQSEVCSSVTLARAEVLI